MMLNAGLPMSPAWAHPRGTGLATWRPNVRPETGSMRGRAPKDSECVVFVSTFEHDGLNDP